MSPLGFYVSILLATSGLSFLDLQSLAATSLNAAEIREAIAFGESGSPSPYILDSAFSGSKVPTALVYTARIRIALAARQAMQAKRQYQIADVDDETASPLIHVVMSADSVAADRKRLTDTDPVAMEIVARRDFRLLGSPESEKAVWVRYQPDRSEPSLRGSSFHGVLTGAFTRQQFCGGCFLVLYRKHQAEDGSRRVAAAWAAINPSGLEDWR